MFKLWRRASHKKVVQKETINVQARKNCKLRTGRGQVEANKDVYVFRNRTKVYFAWKIFF